MPTSQQLSYEMLINMLFKVLKYIEVTNSKVMICREKINIHLTCENCNYILFFFLWKSCLELKVWFVGGWLSMLIDCDIKHLAKCTPELRGFHLTGNHGNYRNTCANLNYLFSHRNFSHIWFSMLCRKRGSLLYGHKNAIGFKFIDRLPKINTPLRKSMKN